MKKKEKKEKKRKKKEKRRKKGKKEERRKERKKEKRKRKEREKEKKHGGPTESVGVSRRWGFLGSYLFLKKIPSVFKMTGYIYFLSRASK